MKPGFSLWIINKNDEKIFGIGPYKLLLLIDELGSLNKAAKWMNISYTKARNILNRAEAELNVILLEREIGGAKGGGSTLTEEARILIDKYNEFMERSNQAIETIYKDIFD